MKNVYLMVVGPGGNEHTESISSDISIKEAVYLLNMNDTASKMPEEPGVKVTLHFLTEDGRRAEVTLSDTTSLRESEHCRFAPGCYITMQSMEQGVNLTEKYHELILQCESTGEPKPTTGDFVKDWLATRAS